MRSDPALRTARVLALAVALPLCACDALSPDPGADFAIAVLNADSTLLASDQLAPATIAFSVAGCASFAATLSGYPLVASHLTAATYTAAFPQDLLWQSPVGACVDPNQPVQATLDLAVACADGRTLSAPFTASGQVGLATRSASASPLSAAVALPTGGVLALSGTDLVPIDAWGTVGVALGGLTGAQAGVVPLLATTGESFYLAAGCPLSGCGFQVALPDGGDAGGSWLETGSLDGATAPALTPIPGTMAIGMQIDRSGALAILSHDAQATYFSQLSDAGARLLGSFLGATSTSGLAVLDGGTLAFLALSADPEDASSVLWDGSTLSTFTFPLPWSGSTQLFLSPDGARWLAVQSDQPWLGALELDAGALVPDPATPLSASTAAANDGQLSLAWLPQGVALGTSDANGASLLAFDAQGLLLYSLDLFSLSALTPVGDSLAVTTQTGLQIVQPDGGVLLGFDPLPCAASPAAPAIALAPGVVALPVGGTFALFDVSGARPLSQACSETGPCPSAAACGLGNCFPAE